jgi:DNA invertase Pin-like site-specific DNA recombinase
VSDPIPSAWPRFPGLSSPFLATSPIRRSLGSSASAPSSSGSRAWWAQSPGPKPSRHLYEDTISGKRDDRPGLAACLKALRDGDTLIVWKLDRLGRDLRHPVNTVHDPTARGIGFKVLTGHGATIDTTSPSGKLVFGIFAALAEFERELIIERTRAGMAAARARGRSGVRPYKMTAAKLRLAMAAMGKPETKVGELCTELVLGAMFLGGPPYFSQ